jgi:hypothetical protein
MFHLLMAERRRVSEAFRARLTCLAMLRGQLAEALTDEARQRLYAAVDEESAICRELGEKLLALDASILDLRARETPQQRSPLLSAPLDF